MISTYIIEAIIKVIRQFSTDRFIKYPLSNSILINNYKVIYLINYKSLLVKGSFQYIKKLEIIFK